MRPYYISVTAMLEQHDDFQRAIRKILPRRPFHQLPVKKKHMHFTLLPLVKITESPSCEPMENFAVRLLDECRPADDSIVLSEPITISLNEWHCYDSGLCPQFESSDKSLGNARESLREALKKIHDRLIAYKWIDSDLKERNAKNSGNKCFGSVARAMCPGYEAKIRWKEKVEPKIDLKIHTVYLLVSDEYLSNQSAHEDINRVVIQTSTSDKFNR
jgi:hypothetical protein